MGRQKVGIGSLGHLPHGCLETQPILSVHKLVFMCLAGEARFACMGQKTRRNTGLGKTDVILSQVDKSLEGDNLAITVAKSCTKSQKN